MFNFDNIPDFKTNKLRISIPRTDEKPGYGNIIYLLSPKIEDNVKKIKNSLINYLNLYKYIYKDYKIKMMIFNKPFMVNYLSQRKDDYLYYETNLKDIHPITSFISVKSRNIFIDTTYYMDIFFSFKKSAIKLVYSEFINLLRIMIEDEKYFKNYNRKYMIIDINDWNITKKEIKQNGVLTNPLSILYITMKKDVELLKLLGNIDIIITNNNISLFKFNPKNLNNKSFNEFKREINKIKPNLINDDVDSLEDSSSSDIETEKDHQNKLNLLKEKISQSNQNVLNNEDIKTAIYTRIDEIKKDNKELSDEEVVQRLETDGDLIKQVQDIQSSNTLLKTSASTARDDELRKEQAKLKVNGKTLSEILDSNKIEPIEEFDISDKINTLNNNITKVKFSNFEKSYNKKTYEKDLISVVADLSNRKDLPIFIRKIDRIDSSDSMNQKETLTFHLEDGNRIRHTLTLDVPKFIDDKFMYLSGNKKIFIKQLFLKPIVKISPDVVQICSNFKKIFMYRYGTQASPKIDVFKKVLRENPKLFEIVRGNGFAESGNVKTTIEYDSLAKEFISIKVKGSKNIFIFSQEKIKDIINKKPEIEKKNFNIGENELIVGFTNNFKYPIPIDVEMSQSTEINDNEVDAENEDTKFIDIIDRIIFDFNSIHGKDFYKKISSDVKVGKRFIYTRCKIMAKNIPTIILLSYYEGLSTVLRKASVEHYFTDKRPTSSSVDKTNQGIIEFSDGYLVYQRYPLKNSILMNGLTLVPTKLYKYEEFDSKPVYLDIFDIMFNARILASGLDSFYDNMIDPITKEILEQLNYPTDFVSLLLFASSLLCDNNYTSEIDMNVFRVRSNEMVSAMMYQLVANAYSKYKRTAGNKSPAKISIPKDALIKEILTSQIIEDYSTLNPIVEIEKSRAITSKGPSGINLEQAYTEEKRSFHKTMTGVLGLSTSPDANVGVVRELTLEPNIVGTRGFIDVKNDLNKIKDVNLFSAAELLTPLGVTRDDSFRTSMASKQSKHIMPVSKSSPVLISNGAEKVLPYDLSSDFTVVAKYDGIVKEYNKDNGMMVIEYSNPEEGEDKYQVINLNPVVVKNGANGFYLSNKMNTNLKVDQKFKQYDVIAFNDKFFGNYFDGVKFNIGTLVKVACMSGYDTFEDSTLITTKASNKMASEVVMEKHIILGQNATIDFIVKKGDKIEVGDPLIKFEQSKTDESINKLLSDIGKDLQEEIIEIGKTTIKSKYTGVIEDIKIYSTIELDEMSPSLRKVVSQYYSDIKKKRDLIKKYKIKKAENTGNTYMEIDEKIVANNGKVKGYDVDGVLIEFYIKYFDPIAVGDKVVNFAALKSVVGEIIPEDKEPFSEYRPDEEISTVFPPGAVLGRMVPSVLITIFTNKLLVELKRQLGDIYFDDKYDYTKDFK